MSAQDYVSEKIWQALLAGTLPIYKGAPNVADFLPCKHKECIIDANDFENMKDLAKYLQNLVDNPGLYSIKHRWRQTGNAYERWMVDYSKFMKYVSLSVDTFHCRLCHNLRSDCSPQELPEYSAELQDIYGRGHGATKAMTRITAREDKHWPGIERPYDIIKDSALSSFQNFLQKFILGRNFK